MKESTHGTRKVNVVTTGITKNIDQLYLYLLVGKGSQMLSSIIQPKI